MIFLRIVSYKCNCCFWLAASIFLFFLLSCIILSISKCVTVTSFCASESVGGQDCLFIDCFRLVGRRGVVLEFYNGRIVGVSSHSLYSQSLMEINLLRRGINRSCFEHLNQAYVCHPVSLNSTVQMNG